MRLKREYDFHTHNDSQNSFFGSDSFDLFFQLSWEDFSKTSTSVQRKLSYLEAGVDTRQTDKKITVLKISETMNH